jgi:hypothetical protein
MGFVYDFTEIDGPVDEDERKTQARRQFMYSAVALAAAEVAERAYVMFPEFKRALEAFDRIYQLSGQLETPQGALVQGPPGSSKTTLAKYFAKSLPQSNLFDIGYGAIFMRLRANPTQGLVVSQLLRAVKYPFTEVRKNRVYTMRDIAFEALGQKGTKIVFVDQAHCLATQAKTRHFDVPETAASDTLREMMDETKVGLVLLADAMFKGLEQVDAALADRISVRLNMSHFAEGPVWQAFLDAFSKKIDVVDMSVIATVEGAAATHLATSGNRRSIRRLMTEGVLVAVDAGAKSLTMQHLSLAFERTRGDGTPKANPYAT